MSEQTQNKSLIGGGSIKSNLVLCQSTYSMASPKFISSNNRRSYLCKEIALNILCRLPTKSLMRFQSTSHSWFSIINDQNLIKPKALPSALLGFFYHGHTYNQYGPQKQPLTFYEVDDHHHHPDDNVIDTSLGFLPALPDRKTEIMDSCNGLLLIRHWAYHYFDSIYYVCNPATKRWTVLPHLPHWDSLLRLDYDPNVCLSHYKVISVPFISTGLEPRQDILIFSSKSGDRGWVSHGLVWRPQHEFLSRQHRPGAPLLNGALYIPNRKNITRYTLLEGVEHTIEFPNDDKLPLAYPNLRGPFFGILGGSICCSMLAKPTNQSHLRIWTLEEKNDKKRRVSGRAGISWVLRHDVEFVHLGTPLVLAFDPFSEVVLLQTREEGVWGYDLDTRTRVDIGTGGLRSETRLEHFNVAFPYTPCLYGCFNEGGEAKKLVCPLTTPQRLDNGGESQENFRQLSFMQ